MSATTPLPRPVLRRLALASLTAAISDFSYVFVLWVLVRQKITTVQLLQSIATGVLGRAAYDGGPPTALLGGVLHLTIATIWSTLYLLLVRTLPRLRRGVETLGGRIGIGLAFGMLIWWCMDLIVLPLSQARATPFLSWNFLINSVQHAIMIGLPLSLWTGTGGIEPRER